MEEEILQAINSIQKVQQTIIRMEGDTATVRRWPKHDPDPNHCGNNNCKEQGEHSWFNHSQDGLNPDYPPNFDRSIDG